MLNKLEKTKKFSCICLLIAIIASSMVAIMPAQALMGEAPLTLKSGSTTITLSPSDVYAMPSYTGYGCIRKSGDLESYGNYTGIPLKYLINMVGGITSSSSIHAEASDGFEATYTYSDIYNNGLVMYNSTTNTRIYPTDATFILAYACNGSDYFNSPRLILVRPLSNYPDGVAMMGNKSPKNVTLIEVLNPPANPLTFKTSDSSGTAKSTYNLGENVYFTATGLSTLTTYPIYVVQDVASWTFHTALPTCVSGSAVSVTTDNSGNIAADSIYSNAQGGKYDVVVDVNNNGEFDESDLLINNVVTTGGMFVLPEYSFGALFAVVACFVALVAFVALKSGVGISRFSARKAF